MSFIHDILDISLSAAPPQIQIEFPEILDAYFAKKNTEPEYEESIEEYTVRSGDSLSRIANRYRSSRNDNGITVQSIKNDNGLSNNTIHPGDVLRIHSREIIGESINFEYINKGSIGQEVYIVVETTNFRENVIKINIRQGVERVLAEVDSPIQVIQGGNPIVLIETNVGEFADSEDITNKDDFRDWAIVKIALQPNEANTQAWTDAIADTDDKKALLYLLIDAHSGNSEYDADRIVYYGRNPDEEGNPDTNTIRNYWLDMEGKWFELANVIAPWMEIARAELGVRERDRTGGGFERVEEYYRDGAGMTLHPINNAWCSSFANWVIIKTNEQKNTNYSHIPLGSSSNPSGANNWYHSTRYPGGNRIAPTSRPPYGAILVMQKTTGWQGHAAFVSNYEENGDTKIFDLLGGNQKHSVCVQRYIFRRSGSNYIYTSKGGTRFKLRGFVVPQEYNFDENDERYYEYQTEEQASIAADDGR